MTARARLGAVAVALALGACGGDDHDHDHVHVDAAAAADADPAAPDADPAAPDADPAVPDAAMPDAGPPARVVEVTCPGSVAATVTAPSFAFTISPDPTIAAGDVVRFEMPATHSVVSGTVGMPTNEFPVGFNQVKCYQFNEAGSYPFFCNPHSFTATLVVQ